MAKPARLTYDKDDELKVKASLMGGRYYFTLRDGAKVLLEDALGYDDGEVVSWRVFKILVIAGDANLPNAQDSVELAADLAPPPSPRRPSEREVRLLGKFLETRELSDRQVSAVAEELTTHGLDSHLDLEAIDGKGSGSLDLPSHPDASDSASESDSDSSTEEPAEAGSVHTAEIDPDATEPETTESGVTADDADSSEAEPSSGGIEDPFVQDLFLLAQRLVQSDVESLESLPNDELVDFYTLLSEVQKESNSLRKEARDVLVERLRADERSTGAIGTVECSTRTRRSLKSEDEVFATLSASGVSHTDVLSVQLDKKKLESVADEHAIPETNLFDVEKSKYVRRVGTDEEKKREALARLSDGE